MSGLPSGAQAAAGRRYVLGAGRVYLATIGATGVPGGERLVGSSPGFELTVSSEQTDVYDDDGPVAERVVSLTRQVAHAFNLQCKDISPENLALFVGGGVVSQVDAATAMDGDPASDPTPADARDKFVVDAQDRFFKLGIVPVASTSPVRPAKPAGVRAISPTPAHTVVSSDSDGTTVIERAPNNAAVNYVVDAAHGRIYIPAGSSITAGDTIYVQYTPVAAAAIPRVEFDEPRQIRASLRYIEDSANKNVPVGNYGWEFFAPLCTVTPGGGMQVKSRENPEIITLSVSVQEPSSGPSFTMLQQAS